MLAVGKDVNAVDHRLAPIPMGPGAKPRDDSGMYSLKTKKPVPRFGGRSAAPCRKSTGGCYAQATLPPGQPHTLPTRRLGKHSRYSGRCSNGEDRFSNAHAQLCHKT